MIRSPYDLANVVQVALATQFCKIHLCGASLNHTHGKVMGKIRSWSAALRSGRELEVPIFYHLSLYVAVQELKKQGCMIVGTSPHAQVSYLDINYCLPTAIVFGTETSGLSAAKVAIMDQLVTVPMKDVLDFMTISVVTPVIVYEALRQRRAAGLV